MPSEVQALSSSVTTSWQVTTENSIGTVCGWEVDSRFPTIGPTDTDYTSIDYNDQGITGTIPTQFGVLTDATSLRLKANWFAGPIPTELGKLSKMIAYFYLHENKLDSAVPTGESGSVTRSVPIRPPIRPPTHQQSWARYRR